MRFPVLLLVLASLLFLSACTVDDGFDAGHPITPEELESLAALYGSEDTEQLPAEGDTVYWTEGGSVCHRDRDCRYLKKSQNIKSGSYTAACQNGKDALCSACGGQS